MTTSAPVVASAAWADRASLVDREFVGSWTTITDENVDDFERGTLVAENANGLDLGVYPDGLIEGFHLLALLDHLVNEVSFIEDPKWSGWNYGLDRVRFTSPVTIHDRIRVRGRVVSLEERESGVVVLYHCTVEVEGREKPGMVAEWRVIWDVEDDD